MTFLLKAAFNLVPYKIKTKGIELRDEPQVFGRKWWREWGGVGNVQNKSRTAKFDEKIALDEKNRATAFY